jgi:hypothetical protein
MSAAGTILLFGTGVFAQRIACDIAATARHPVQLVLAGRNGDRLDWLKTACNARAATFGTGVHTRAIVADLASAEAITPAVAAARPDVVVQVASVQGSAIIAQRADAWSRLVAEGGLSATAVFQALLSARVGKAMRAAAPNAVLVNGCFPDVVNTMLAALGLPVACGVGNVGILSACFGGALGPGGLERVKVLAHYQTIGAWRRPATERAGHPPPRVWIDDTEVADVHARFAALRLTPEPAIEVSGSASVPLLVAMATRGTTLTAHAPGALGLPGGYPVRWADGALALDLPSGLSREDAVAWNRGFEARNGLLVSPEGRVTYTGVLQARLHALAPSLAVGFALHELEAVHAEMAALRQRLQAA